MSIPQRPVPEDRSAPPPTARLGRYEITGRIATGGMATVYLGRLEATGGFSREFALKVVHPHLVAEEGFIQRFHREAKLASRVRHQNVVATIDADEDKGYCYLVLELIEGATLRQVMLHRDRPFAAVESAFIVSEVARGLHALHTSTDENGRALNIIHRDLSPHNIMLDDSGRPVLIDLGLAKAADNPHMTQVGVLCGKLPYMSPEQSRLDNLDARSDVFALGTVLYELCTGDVPFGDSHTTATLERLQKCDTEEITAGLERMAVPRWLTEIIVGCLRPDPEDRYQTALQIADALTQKLVASGHSAADLRDRLAGIMREAMPEIGLVTPIDPMAPALRGTGRSRALRWMGLGALTAVFVFGGLYLGTHLLPDARVKSDGGTPLFGDVHVAPEPNRQQVTSEEAAAEDAAAEAPVPTPGAEPGTSPPPPAEAAAEELDTDGASGDSGASGTSDDGGGEQTRRRFRPRPKKNKSDDPLRERNPYR